MHCSLRVCVTLSLACVPLACDHAAEGLHGIDGAPGFGPYTDMDQDVIARRIIAPPPSLAHRNVGKLDVAPDGSIRLWRRSALAERFDNSVLERYSPDGRLEERRDLGDGASVVFHPEGELTVARQSAEGATEYVRRSSSFAETARVLVPDTGAMVALPDFYRVADDGTFTTEPGGLAVERPFTSLVADNDGGFYAVQMFIDRSGDATPVRLVRLDAHHAVVATTWMLPGAELPVRWRGEPIVIDGEVVTPILRYRFEDVQLLVDRQGRVWALSSGPGRATGALSQSLGRPVDLRDSGELFVLRYSASLELEAVVSLPAPNAQEFAFITEGADGTIGIAALSDELRAIEPNKTHNYNAFFASLDRDGNIIGSRELDIDRDDWPYALAACGGRFCICGETGTRWVDTGSQVDFAQGFIMAVGLDGSPARLSTLHGPRRNAIETLATRDDGSVVFAGTTDGPITHTDPTQRSLTALLGVMPF